MHIQWEKMIATKRYAFIPHVFKVTCTMAKVHIHISWMNGVNGGMSQDRMKIGLKTLVVWRDL